MDRHQHEERLEADLRFRVEAAAGIEKNLHRTEIAGITSFEAKFRLCERLAREPRNRGPMENLMKRFEDEFPTEWALSPEDPKRDLGQPATTNDQETKTVDTPVKPLVLAAGASGRPAW